jgi:integrase
MLAVANFSYLYCRNKRYYLRLTIQNKQIWISLKTDSLDIAVHIRSQIKSLLSNTLVISKLNSCQLSKFLLTIKQKIDAALISFACISLQKDLGLNKVLPSVNPPAKKQSSKPKFSQVAKESILRSKASLKGLKGYERNLEIWLHLVKDKPIDEYTTREIGQAIDRCFQLPVANKSPYNRMSWKQRVKCKVSDESDKVSRKSVGAIYKWLKSVFAFACDEEIGYIEKNPCTIKRDFKAATRGYFDDDELRLMQEGVMNPEKSWHKWVTLIAMYHGMRRGEICQLRREDIQLDSKTQRPFFFVRSLGTEQNVKTANSIRKIPIHKTFLSLGFMDWINEKEGKIFEGIEAHAVTGWFSRFMNNCNVAGNDEYGNVRSFHSFRHSFITKVRNAYPNLQHVQEVVGHRLQQGKTTDQYTHIIKQMTYLIAVVDSFTLD